MVNAPFVTKIITILRFIVKKTVRFCIKPHCKNIELSYFFFKYFTLSNATAARMIKPLNTNCKFVSMPRNVRQ